MNRPCHATLPRLPLLAAIAVLTASSPALAGPQASPSEDVTPPVPVPAEEAPPQGPGGGPRLEAPSTTPEGPSPALFASCAQLWSSQLSPSCRATLQPARDGVQACLTVHAAPRSAPMRVEFVVETGAVQTTTIAPGADTDLGRCVRATIESLRFADEPGEESIRFEIAASVAGPPAGPSAAPDAAWAAYHEAFVESVIGRSDLSKQRLTTLITEHPGHPASLLAADLLRRLDTTGGAFAEPEVLDERYGTLRSTGLARAELASYQTMAGIGAAAALCTVAECDDARIWVAMLTLGGAAGLTGALVATRKNGISPGRALAINTGTMWGVWNGIAISVVAEAGGRGTAGAILASQLAGLGAGIAVASFGNPTAGDVSMATSSGLWLGGFWFFLNGLTDFKMIEDGKGVLASTLIASDIGIIAGAVLAATDVYRMSRSRALLIDSGGVVGTLLGAGLSVLIKGDIDSAPAVFGPALAGMLVGLGSTFYLTQDWDAPSGPELAVGIAPTLEGGMALSVGGRF